MNEREAGKGKTVSDHDKMRSEEIRFLIGQKISYINSTVNVSMLWWVSSFALCGYVLFEVWLNQDKLEPPIFVFGLGFVLFVFFFFISYFGILVARRSDTVQKEVVDLVNELKYANELGRNKGNFFQSEIISFQMSMRMGAFSFALVFAVWDFCWLLLLCFKSPSTWWAVGWALGWDVWNGVCLYYVWKHWPIFLRRHWVEEIFQPDEDMPNKKGNDVLDKPEHEQKNSRQQRATAGSKRRYIDALLPASIFIASTTTLFIIYKSFTPRDVNRPLSSDVAIWFTVFTSAIGTFSAIILAWRSDRRDARMKALEIAKLERELAASSEKPALPIAEEKRK